MISLDIIEFMKMEILKNIARLKSLSCESHPLSMLTALSLETLHTSTRWAADNTV